MALGLKRRENASESAQFMEMYNALRAAQDQNELLEESVEDLQRAVDEIGWAPLFGAGATANETGFQMDSLRKLTSQTRSLVAANPLVRKGVKARTGFVWGEGVTVTGNKTKQIVSKNNKLVFSAAAKEELESALATDGNVIFILNRLTQKIIRVPISQVSEYILSPEDGESIQFIKRTWAVSELNPSTGNVHNVTKNVWYPTVEYIDDGGTIPALIKKDPVEQNQAINVVSVNKQIGWTWGVPDLLSVLFWARAYKEFLEAEYTLVRALSRFAFKITDTRPSGSGANKAAVRLARPAGVPGIDAGGTASMSGGMDMVAINKAGANVSFDAGRPLAAMVGAGLEVPLSILLAEAGQSTNNYEISLDPSTVKSVQARQDIWIDEFERMFRYLGATTAKVEFPPIQSAPIHRVIQSIVTAASTGIMWPEEVRELTIKTLVDFGLNPKDGLPDPEEWQAYSSPKQENPGTPPLNTPDGSNSKNRSPAGAMADGSHEMRPSE